MAFVPQSVFNILQGNANYRKIQSQITASPAPTTQTYNVYYKVDGPITTLKTPNFSIPDGTLTSLSATATMPLVNLPLDSYGNTLEGLYTLTYYIEDTLLPGQYTLVVSSITLDVYSEGLDSCRVQPRIDVKVNCVCYDITVSDNVTFPSDATVTTHTLTVIPPTIPGQPTPVNLTTTQNTLTFSFGYTNVTYVFNSYYEFTHTNLDGTITVQENIIGQLSQRIVCDFNLCKLVICINDTIGKLERKAAAVGGWPNLPLYMKDQYAQLNQLWMLMEMYRTCGNYTKVYEIYQRIVDLVNCDCGCTESNCDTPVQVNPACGGNNAITNVIGQNPIQVNIVGSTANISLDPAFATWNTWIEFDNTFVASLGGVIDYSNVPFPVRYSVNTHLQQMRVDGMFEITGGSSPICLNVDINITLPVTTRLFIPIPAFNTNGVCVGSVVLVQASFGIPGSYRMLFTPNFFSATATTVLINGIYNLD